MTALASGRHKRAGLSSVIIPWPEEQVVCWIFLLETNSSSLEFELKPLPDWHEYLSSQAVVLLGVASTCVQLFFQYKKSSSKKEDECLQLSVTSGRGLISLSGRDTNMLVSWSNIAIMPFVMLSSAVHTLARQVSTSVSGVFQYAHQVLSSYCPVDSMMWWPPPLNHQVCSSAAYVFDCWKNRNSKLTRSVTQHEPVPQARTPIGLLGIHWCASLIELKPWPNWHGHQDNLPVALLSPHSSIVIWFKFSYSVYKYLIWSPHSKFGWEYCLLHLLLHKYLTVLILQPQFDEVLLTISWPPPVCMRKELIQVDRTSAFHLQIVSYRSYGLVVQTAINLTTTVLSNHIEDE